MKTKSFFIFSVLLGWCFSSFAGTASFKGEGRVEAVPEAVHLTMTVTSECYDNAVEASSAGDEVSNNVIEILESYVNSEEVGDGVFATGGYVQRYTGYDPILKQKFCINKYKKINTITLKTSNIDDFAGDFAVIQDRVYSLNLDPQERIDEPTIYVQIQTPQPYVKSETQKQLYKSALKMAVEDAMDKVKVALKAAGYTNFVLTKYQEMGNSTPQWPKKVGSSSRDAAPVNFDKMWIESQISAEFSF